jgi:hypothetical protein
MSSTPSWTVVLLSKNGSSNVNSPNTSTAQEAAKQGTRVAAEWRGGVGSLVRLCVGILNGFVAFEGNKALLDAFFAPLVEAGVFTVDEARLGRSASKVSMLITIGQHEQMLQRPDIARQLMAGFTIVYQACQIYKIISGDDERKTVDLSRILAECPEHGAREYLLTQTRLLKRGAAAREDKPPPADAFGQPVMTASLRQLIEEKRQFDLLVLTPGHEYRLIGEDYPYDPMREGTVLERNLPIHQIVDDNAVIVVAAKEHELPLVSNKLLDLCGFARTSEILLADQPGSRRITDSDIIVIAKRGRARINVPANVWNDRDGALQPLSLAAEVFPQGSRRLHVFASAQTAGWCCVSSEDSWLKKPTVR